jgi:hypothetical protein
MGLLSTTRRESVIEKHLVSGAGETGFQEKGLIVRLLETTRSRMDGCNIASRTIASYAPEESLTSEFLVNADHKARAVLLAYAWRSRGILDDEYAAQFGFIPAP